MFSYVCNLMVCLLVVILVWIWEFGILGLVRYYFNVICE